VEKQALSGVKVVDFTWVITGPIVTKCLADHGAEVVRLEFDKRPDIIRTSAPIKDGASRINRSGYFAFFNSNKYGVNLNLNHPQGIEIAKRMVKRADVVVENFAPGMMEKWGLGYEDLKKIKEDIIVLRCSLQGQTGPHASQPGLGAHLVSFAGFTHFTGYTDGDPMQPFGAYTDLIAPPFALAALLGALLRRRRTGSGQCIDLSQYEASLQFLLPALMDYLVNGREGGRQGNSSPCAAPHGAYPCKGDDRWCAIAVTSDTQWRSFCDALENPHWTKKPAFATLLGRKANEENLNDLVAEWTRKRTPEDVMATLQKAGVPAGVVESPADLLQDAQLDQRRQFWMMNHPELGLFPHLGQSFALSDTPSRQRMPTPCLGEHTEYVCKKLLGMSDSEFMELVKAGVIG